MAEISPDAPGAAIASPVTATQVLDHHASLHDLLAHPNGVAVSIVKKFGEWSDERQARSWLSRYMFWPYRTGGKRSSTDWEARFLVGVARGLFTATTYQVTAPMCEIAEVMYEQTAVVNGHVEPADLPSECGFLWLDKPWQRTDSDGTAYQTRAITWSPVSTRWKEYDCREDGVRVTLWSDWEHSPETADYWNDLDQATRAALGPLVMAFTVVLPFGAEFAGEDSDQVPTPLHYVYAVWLLLGTEVTVTSRGAVMRQARKRAARSIRHHEVSVVTLRRAAARPDGEHVHREVDWSCCWLVRGFWRHLEGYGTVGRFHEAQGDGRGHCLACGARVTWVRPHVRGPDDRPLKDTQKLYRLSR
jgi:hypothetical protein